MLAVETLEKRPYLLERYQKASKESLSGPINRSLFWWMNPLFLVGYRKPIGQEDLYELDDELRSERLARIMSRKWETGTATCAYASGCTNGFILSTH
jgi:hypothetical protein